MSSGCRVGAMSLDQSFQKFEADHRARGFDEVMQRRWPPLTELATHEHEFQVKALVVDGEMWLAVEAETHHLRAGSTFELEAWVPHAERYGSEGATYWVARRRRPLA
ncbi:MAG: hypothetical protein NVS9B2_21220 [Steroidobacteraceae bacterium]